MSRSALVASLALHAGLVGLVGWRSLCVGCIGSGDPGADASFVADTASGTFLADTVPAASPEPVSQPQFTETALTPPAPAWGIPDLPICIVAVAPAQHPIVIAAPPPIPMTEANPSFTNTGKAKHRVPSRSRGNAIAREGAGTGSGGSGHGNAGYAPPRFLLRYKPPYPEEARSQRMEGTVLLLVLIDATGHVVGANVQCSCRYRVLDRAALAAVRSWRFEPARQDGMAIAARVEVPVRFRFEDRSAAQK